MLPLLETNARCSGPTTNRNAENYRLFCMRQDLRIFLPDCGTRHAEILNSKIVHIEQQIAEQNIWLVLNIIKIHFRPNEDIDFDTCVDCGTEGMMRAIRKFDVRRGIQFNTYAYRNIRVRISRAFKNYTKHHANRENIPLNTIRETIEDLNQSSDQLTQTEAKKWDEDISEILIPYLENLTEKECQLLRLRFWEDLSLEEIGCRFGLNRQNIKQKIDCLLKKLAIQIPSGLRHELFS